jgi:cobalt-zinc-cadmium efflux system outer membrane protein
MRNSSLLATVALMLCAACAPRASGASADRQQERVSTQPEIGLSPPSQAPEKTTLEAVLRLAAKGPMVEAARHRWLAATHKRPQVAALPDPRLEATYYIVRGMDKYMLGLSQEIPYPGKLILAGRIADKEAEAARLRYEAAVRDALSDAKESYFELYYVDRAQQVTAEIRKLYDRYAALAAGGTEVAKPKLPETFRAESQRAQLGYDLVLLREMRAAEAERLRSGLGLPARAELGGTEDVAEPAELGETLEHLMEIATAHNQELAAAGVEVERAQYEVKQAHRAPIPDLMIGANYTAMGEQQRKMMGVDNPHGITAGFSLPLWVPKYRAMAKEAGENEKAAEAEQTAQRLKVRADLAKAYFSLNNSARLVKLYRETLLPQARQALGSAEELYRKGDANLASVLETTATLHNFELARLRATSDFYQNVARLERTLGTAMKLKAAGKPEAKP